MGGTGSPSPSHLTPPTHTPRSLWGMPSLRSGRGVTSSHPTLTAVLTSLVSLSIFLSLHAIYISLLLSTCYLCIYLTECEDVSEFDPLHVSTNNGTPPVATDTITINESPPTPSNTDPFAPESTNPFSVSPPPPPSSPSSSYLVPTGERERVGLRSCTSESNLPRLQTEPSRLRGDPLITR